MSRITERPAVAPINPWTNISTGTANQAYSAIPASGSQPSTGTGFFAPDFTTYIGQKFDTSDGRELALVSSGAAITAGKVVQSEAQVTAHQKLAMTVPTAYPATAGTYKVYVTNGSTVLNENKFASGFLIVCYGTGLGQTLKISSHQAAAASAAFVVTLEDPIQTTLDATSKVSLLQNPFANVITAPDTTATGGPVGVSLYGIAAPTAATYDGTSGALTVNGVAQYGLIVTHGPCAVLVDNSVTGVGYPVGVSKVTAGSVGVATLTTTPMIGINAQTQTSAYYGLINLML